MGRIRDGTAFHQPLHEDCRAMTSKPPLEPEVIDLRGGGPRKSAELAQLQFLARIMDSVFEIPGLRIRFGFDALLGLIPGFGDFATSLVTLFILQEAHRRGVSRLTLARMGANILVDWLVGSIPVAGDVFDVYWKSNQRNVELLLQHEANASAGISGSKGDWLFLIAVIAALVAVLIGSLSVSYFVISSLMRWLFPA
jgi:hypothetical protein